MAGIVFDQLTAKPGRSLGHGPDVNLWCTGAQRNQFRWLVRGHTPSAETTPAGENIKTYLGMTALARSSCRRSMRATRSERRATPPTGRQR